jgi:hypothetical protein
MEVQIQSRDKDGRWIDEARTRNQLSAYLAAKAKSLITGKSYRLVDADGSIVEIVS